MKIIGHRGAAGIALENTAESIKAALKLPIDGIEIDVRRTKDGHLVVIHDEDTSRIGEEARFVAETNLKDLKKVRLNNGEHLLTLEEALALVKDKVPLILDLKSADLDKDLAPILARHKNTRLILSSRSYPQLARLRKIFPELPFTPRSYANTSDIIHIAQSLGGTGISLNKWMLNPLTYFLARRVGLDVHTYTVDSPLLFRLFKRLYPDLYFITNHPERFVGKIKK